MARTFDSNALLERMAHKADLLSLGSAVSRVAEMADTETSTLSELANLILSDLNLTQKVLRLGNSVTFRSVAGPVTTVSRAIARIGSEQVRILALSSLLLERLTDRQNAAAFSPELMQALYASMLAQSVGPRSGTDGEESAICAMFRSIGRLIIVLYESECFAEIKRVAASDRVSDTEAARRVMGVGFEQIGQRILTRWGIPDLIVKTVAPWPAGADPPRDKVERLQLVSQFSSEVAAAVCASSGNERAKALESALSNYGASLSLEAPELQVLVETTSERTHHFARALDLELAPTEVQAVVDDARTLATEIELPAADAVDRAEAASRSGADRPRDSNAILLAGLQDMTTGLAEGHDLSSVINIAVETLYCGLGYQRALLCLRDPHTKAFRARIQFGHMPRERLHHFAFPATPASDLFWSVMQRNVDVHIRDVTAPNIHSALPPWYRSACPDAKSFVLLPLAFKHKPLGFFYADRPTVDEVGLTTEELALVRMLKGQTLIALRTAATA
jgi:HD-like signal output (HDOD) protein